LGAWSSMRLHGRFNLAVENDLSVCGRAHVLLICR